MHPERGSVVVPAYCRIDAQLQAAAIWDVTLDEVMERCKLGLKKEQLEQLRQNLVSEEPSAGGVGLQNLYSRLKLLYGEDARLNIDAKELQGTTVSFIIPLEREEEHVSGAAGR